MGRIETRHPTRYSVRPLGKPARCCKTCHKKRADRLAGSVFHPDRVLTLGNAASLIVEGNVNKLRSNISIGLTGGIGAAAGKHGKGSEKSGYRTEVCHGCLPDPKQLPPTVSTEKFVVGDFVRAAKFHETAANITYLFKDMLHTCVVRTRVGAQVGYALFFTDPFTFKQKYAA